MIGIPGILGREWRQFIQASEEYLKKNMPAAYPATHDPCAYCRQPLTASAVQLLKKYRDFSSNEIGTALDTAERQLRDYARRIRPAVRFGGELLLKQVHLGDGEIDGQPPITKDSQTGPRDCLPEKTEPS